VTDYGALPTGYRRKTFDEMLTDVKAKIRGRVGANLALDWLDPVGAMAYSILEELDLAWQADEVSYNGIDPDNAEDFQLEALAALTGVERLGAQTGLVQCTLGLEANKTFQPGQLIAYVVGQPTNRWKNRDVVTSTTAGSYAGQWFISEGAGSLYRAPASSLTVIAQTKSGWVSITNPLDAIAGEDIETIDMLRVRRNGSVGRAGSASTTGIRADVEAVSGVIEARVFENTLAVPADGLPAKSVRVVVWDGSLEEADDDEIAQAIFVAKSAGIETFGSESGTATDKNGDTVTVYFDRAVVRLVYGELTVTAPSGADLAAIKEAVKATATRTIGTGLVLLKARAAALEVAGVTDVPTFKLDLVDPPVNTTTNLIADNDEVLIIDTANLDVAIV
jgi:uncharacterized phage protein gp47/JayE